MTTPQEQPQKKSPCCGVRIGEWVNDQMAPFCTACGQPILVSTTPQEQLEEAN